MIKIEGNKVKFIFKGNAKSVCLAGDFNGWRREKMPQISEETWVLEKSFPMNARFDYKFIADGEELLDADNPLRNEGGFGFSSELRMPHFHYPKAIRFFNNIPHGEIRKYTINDSIYFKYKRDVYVYIPYGAHGKMPALFFQDGLEYILFGAAKNTLDFLIHKGAIPKTVAVFVDIRKERRLKEYSAFSRYAEFLEKLVVPFVSRKTKISFSEKFAVGTSLGGFAAIDTLLKFPEIFSGAISQSGMLMFDDNQNFAALKGKKIYMDYGKYETHTDESVDIPYRNKFFAKRFKNAGANVFLKEWNDGHSWGNWRAHLPAALKSIFGREK